MSEQPRSTALVRMQWTAVIFCAAAIAINYMDRSTLAIANPQIRSEFHINAAQFGALQSAWSPSFAVAQIPIGLLIDRPGPGMLLDVSLVLWSLSVAAGGFAGNYRQLGHLLLHGREADHRRRSGPADVCAGARDRCRVSARESNDTGYAKRPSRFCFIGHSGGKT